MTGEIIFKGASKQNLISIDLSNHAKGFYSLTLISPNFGISNHKLILQ